MATLTNTQISVTYVGLLKTSANTVLSSTAQQITDGSGNNSILYLSTAEVGIGGSPTAGKELDVTGNVLITGDLQVDNININGNTISATSGAVTLSNGTIATTQSQNDNSTKVATTAYVDTAIDGVTLSEVLANGNTTGGTNISVSANDDIDFSDSSEARFGSDQDLIVKHNGSNATIENKVGTLNITQSTDDGDIKFFCDDGSGGTENYLQIDGGEQRIKVFNQMRFNDNVELRLGTANDLQIYHDGSNSYISDEGTGNLFIQASNSLNLRSTSGEWYMDGIANGAVNLYYNNSKKFETTSSGVSVTGGITSDFYKTNISSSGGTSGNQNVYKLGRLTLSQSNGCIIKVLGTVSFGAGNNTSGVTYIFIRGNNASTTLDGHFFGFNKQQNTISEVRYVNISGNVFDIYIKYDGTFAGLDTFVETGGTFDPDLTDTGSTTFPTSVALTSVFSVTTGGAERLVVDSSGLCGIGISNPTNIIHTSTSSNTVGRFESTDANAHIRINDTSDSFYLVTESQKGSIGGNADVNANNLNIDLTNGNIGIGVSAPNNALDIDSSYTNSVHIQGTGSYNLYSYHDSGGVGWATGSGSSYTNLLYLDAANNEMRMYTNGNERIRIESDGDILHTGGNLTMSGGTPFIVLSNTAETESGITFNDSADPGQSAKITYDSGDNKFRFKNNSSNTRITINSSGNVGINDDSPDTAALEVVNIASDEYTGSFDYEDTDGTVGALKVRLSGGSTSPSLVDFIYGTSQVGSIVTTGSSTGYLTSSDYRLKENVVELTGALDRLDNLQPKRFNFTSTPDQTLDGFLAHEVSDCVPEAIQGTKDETYQHKVSDAQDAVEWTDKPTLDNTKVEIQAWLDENNIEWQSADTKQELLDRIPEYQQEAQDAVYETRPKYQGIDQSKLVPLLVAAVKELKARIEVLENS